MPQTFRMTAPPCPTWRRRSVHFAGVSGRRPSGSGKTFFLPTPLRLIPKQDHPHSRHTGPGCHPHSFSLISTIVKKKKITWEMTGADQMIWGLNAVSPPAPVPPLLSPPPPPLLPVAAAGEAALTAAGPERLWPAVSWTQGGFLKTNAHERDRPPSLETLQHFV